MNLYKDINIFFDIINIIFNFLNYKYVNEYYIIIIYIL